MAPKKPKEDLKSLTIRMKESLMVGVIKAQSVMMSEVMVMNHLQRWWAILDDPPTSISLLIFGCPNVLCHKNKSLLLEDSNEDGNEEANKQRNDVSCGIKFKENNLPLLCAFSIGFLVAYSSIKHPSEKNI